MTIEDIIQNCIQKELACPKCRNKKYVVIDRPLPMGYRTLKTFECQECGFRKDLSFEELDNFNTKAVEIIKSALNGDFAYKNTIGELAKEMLNKNYKARTKL